MNFFKFKKSEIFDKTSMDMITLEEITVLEHLDSSPQNFVIRQGEFYHFVNVQNIMEHLEDNTVFPCLRVGGSNPSNVDVTIELFNARKISTIFGYFLIESLMDAMKGVIQKNVRIYDLSPPTTNVTAVVSKLHYQGRTGMVSSLHCQEGSDGPVYKLNPLKISGIPIFKTFDNEFLETDVNLIVMAYTIAKNATSKPKVMESTRQDMIIVGKRLVSEEMGRRYSRDIKHANYYIENPEQTKLLKLWGSFFLPKVNKMVIKEDAFIEDFSFLKNVQNIKHFECKNELTNIASLIHELGVNHSDTLVTLKILPSNILYNTMGHFTSLRKITVINSGENTFALESVLKRVSEIPDLNEINIHADHSPSPNMFNILGKSVSKPKTLSVTSYTFNGSLKPISSLTSLETLYLDLRSLTGNLNGIRGLSKLTKLTTITGLSQPVLGLDSRGMNLKNVIQKRAYVPGSPDYI